MHSLLSNEYMAGLPSQVVDPLRRRSFSRRCLLGWSARFFSPAVHDALKGQCRTLDKSIILSLFHVYFIRVPKSDAEE